MTFSPAQLSAMRSTVESTFDATASRLVKVNTSDGRGGRVVAWESNLEFPCRLSTKPPRTRQEIGEAKLVSDPEYQLVYKHDITLSSTNRVEINGRQYEIIAVFEGSSINLHGRASLRRVE